MQTRFLTVLFGVTFVLTLLFAVAAGAQEDATVSPGGGGVQVQQVQTQQIQAAQVGTMDIETQAQGCQGQKKEFDVGPKSDNTDKNFHIEGDKFRVEYDVDFTDDDPDNEFTLNISNGSKFFTSTSKGDNHEEFVIDEGPGDFTLKANLKPQGKGTYSITVYDCKNAESSNNNGGGGGNNDGGSSSGTSDTTGTGTTDTTGTSTAQADDTTGTADASADPATADAAAGDGANRDGSFRCESFLHVVRDENGNLRRQYRDGDDEVIVQRFEQCLEADVLANTIPNRLLPDTGGPPLLFGGGALLLVAVMVLAGRIIRR